MTTTTAQAAKLTPKATACATLAQLEASLKTGYVPTMSSKNRNQKALGQYLEAHGYRVFWTR